MLGWLERLVVVCLALAAGPGCGEQEIRAIERLPAPISPDRGRVQVRDGNLFTDKGTRLRGATFGVDARPDFVFEQSLLSQMAGEAGLNALHVYLEDYADETGVNAAQADALVELTSKAGMYLLIGIGGGAAGGTFDLDKVLSFWSYYAPRYADRTHVLFEIQNIPEDVCDVPLQVATLDMEREAYATIRASAPDSHVALFSFKALPSAEVLGSSLDALQGSVDWSNASVALHSGACGAADNLPDALETARARSIAAFVSELSNGTPLSVTLRLEAERVGWFNFDWLVFDTDLAAFRAAHAAAGISWCPDFGSWPEDASTCSTP